MNLKEYFPEAYTPRPDQVENLNKIEQCLNSNKKFIIINAPTGTGKSMISATLANLSKPPSTNYISLVDDQKIFQMDRFGNYIYADEVLSEPKFGTYVLTITKTLQDQYNKLFNNAVIFKGKSNYECNIESECTAETAPCLISSNLLKDCKAKSICNYFNQKDLSAKSKFSVLNYSSFLSLPNHVKTRSYIICDEASELEEELVKFFSLEINFKQLHYLPLKVDKLKTLFPNDCYIWLKELQNNISKFLDKFDHKEKISLIEMNKFRYFRNLHEKILEVMKHWSQCQYIIERDSHQVSFTPLYIDTLAEEIFDHAEKVILMSATIIDHKTYTKSLGITDYHFLELDSIFDSKKAPIYCPGKYSLSYKNIDKNISKVANQVITICDHYNDKKGIVHTHSFKITNAIKKVAKSNRFLFREDEITNSHILEEHFLRTDKTVLVSPSLGHGIDLLGDMGEFQVIVKLPYLPLGSKRVKTLFEQNKKWYQMKMLSSLMQMCGRIIRSEEDSGTTFILDGQAVKVLKQNFTNLPKWFVQRLQ